MSVHVVNRTLVFDRCLTVSFVPIDGRERPADGTVVQSGSASAGLQYYPTGIDGVSPCAVINLGVSFAGNEAHAKPSCPLPISILSLGFE